MQDGFLLTITTRLIDPKLFQIENFAVACSDRALAYELLRAEREITADQTLQITGTAPAALLTSMRMASDEVRAMPTRYDEGEMRDMAQAA